MAKRTGQRAFDYAMNACDEASKLLVAMQHTYDDTDKNYHKATADAIAAKHDRLMEKKEDILEAAAMISDALSKLYDLDMSEFF